MNHTFLKCMRGEVYFMVSLLFSCMIWGCENQPVVSEKKNDISELEALYVSDLDSCIYYIQFLKDSAKSSQIESNFIRSRAFFKKAEPILSFREVENYTTLMQPNLLKVEEEDATNIRIRQPEGFQVLEETIFGGEEYTFSTIHQKAQLIEKRLEFIRKNVDFKKFKNYHFLWVLRNSILRTAFTGITGFDSPILTSSLEDAVIVYGRLKAYLSILKSQFRNETIYDLWMNEIDSSIDMLTFGKFDDFDRYKFLKEHTQEQIEIWNATVKDWEVEFPFELALKNDASNLFSTETYNLSYFSKKHPKTGNDQVIALGKKLFNDSNLSAGGNMSCSSCHKENIAFTDGKRFSIGSDGLPVKRNAPTLTYAGFQRAFFHDARSGNLEGQIISVVNSENEFHTDMKSLTKTILSDSSYFESFERSFKQGVTDASIRNAIAAYVRSLYSFDSKFDKNINRQEETLSAEEISGFNLFMGKGACATCHFPPFFNGTVPPRFKESEMESLGVPIEADNQSLDDDFGRYDLFQTEERKHFFKTPTVRNIALTAPYMHNGVYETLEEVMDFYNQGGGAGMGFDLPNQTLPFDSLGLTDGEIKSIIAFMNTLTDEKNY